MSERSPQGRLQEAASVFARVADLPASERSEALDALCPDPEVRREVDSLLRAADAAPTAFLRPIAGAPEQLERRAARRGGEDEGGRRVGRYELLREIARGGMGIVWEAEDLRLGRRVALKRILGGHLAGDEERQRFRVEAEAAARLEHPNIVKVLDFGEVDGRPFYTMELVSGRSLDEVAPELTGRPDAAADLVRKLAAAIAHGHDRGVLHRDLKPANVLMDHRGEPRIIDFGLAKRTDADHALTRTGIVAGTPQYMAPEQARGETQAVGRAADVWALGAILYELLTGRPPVDGDTQGQALERARKGDVVPPSRVARRVPRDLETVCLKCLRPEPERRYPDAGALEADLAAYLRRDPISARRPTLGYVLRLAVRRHVARVLVLATAAALLAGFGVAFVAQQRSALQRERRLRAESQALLLAHSSEDAVGEGRNLLGLRLAREAVALSPSLETHEALRAALAAGGFETLHLEGHVAPVTSVDVSPDGRLFLTGSYDQTARLWDRQGREVARVGILPDAVYSARFSPTSDAFVTLLRRGYVFTWDLDGGRIARLAGPDAPVTAFGFGPDGGLLLVAQGGARLVTERGEILARFPTSGELLGTAVSRRGDRIVTATTDGSVTVWSPDGTRLLSFRVGPRARAAFAGPGDELLVGDATGTVSLRAADGSVHWSRRHAQHAIHRVASGPHAENLAFQCSAGELVRLTSAGRTGFSVSGPRAASFRPDGRALAALSGDGAVVAWPTGSSERRVLRPSRGRAISFRFGPGSRELLAAAWHSATLVGWLDGALGPSFGPERGVLAARLSPDGRTVATLGTELVTWAADGTLRARHAVSGEPRALALSPDGSHALVGTTAGALLVDLAGRTRCALPHAGPARALAIGPSRVLTQPAAATIATWTLDGQPAGDMELPLPRGVAVTATVLLPEGGVAAATSDGRVHAFAADGAPTWTADVGPPGSEGPWLDVSPAGLVAWRLLDADVVLDFGGAVRTVHALAHHQYSEALAMAADGALLRVQKEDKRVRLTDVEGRTLLVLAPSSSFPSSVAFSPDGSRFAIGHADGVVRVHERDGSPVGTLPALSGGPLGVAFSPDGRRVFSHDRFAARLSEYLPEDLVRRADAILWGDFSPEELGEHARLLPEAVRERARASWAR